MVLQEATMYLICTYLKTVSCSMVDNFWQTHCAMGVGSIFGAWSFNGWRLSFPAIIQNTTSRTTSRVWYVQQKLPQSEVQYGSEPAYITHLSLWCSLLFEFNLRPHSDLCFGDSVHYHPAGHLLWVLRYREREGTLPDSNLSVGHTVLCALCQCSADL